MSGVYFLWSLFHAAIIDGHAVQLFPPPPGKPYEDVLRERAQAFRPPTEQSRLEAEEVVALREFDCACAFP